MVTIPEILAVMEPNRAYAPYYIERLIEAQRRRASPNAPLRECERIGSVLQRLVSSGRLRHLPSQRCYALPVKPYRGPEPKKKKKRIKPTPNQHGKRELKPPSLLYRARRLGLA